MTEEENQIEPVEIEEENFAAEKKIDLKSHTLVEFLELLIDKGYYKKNSFVKKLLISFILGRIYHK